MPALNLRHSARAVILDEDDRILLCRFDIPDPPGTVVWAPPGGGVEEGETPSAALRRELREELGLEPDVEPVPVWRQEVIGRQYAPGFDGVIEDFFLVRTAVFQPRGSFTDEQLAAENITGFGWWTLRAVAEYDGTDLFSPRDLATPLAALIADGPPTVPLSLGG